jgi:hypothetical protein
MNGTYITTAGKFAGLSGSQLVTSTNSELYDTLQLVQFEDSDSIFQIIESKEDKEISLQLLLSETEPSRS